MSTKTVSRRDFLKVAGITLGASVVTCSPVPAPVARVGIGFVATRTPEFETPEINYKKETLMNKHILIILSWWEKSNLQASPRRTRTSVGKLHASNLIKIYLARRTLRSFSQKIRPINLGLITEHTRIGSITGCKL